LHINLDKPRGKDGVVLASVGGASSGPLNRRDRKRKAEEGVHHAPPEVEQEADPLQVNFRLINRFRPMLYGGFIDESDGSGAAKNEQQLEAAAAGEKKRKKSAEEDASSNPTEEAEPHVDPNAERPVLVGSSLLVIEAPWLNILQQLPQPMARHRYGT
jgi:hypothetical protein